jgi:hypothetical protein
LAVPLPATVWCVAITCQWPAGYNPVSDYSDHADHWQVMATHQTVAGNGTANIVDGNVATGAGQGGQAGDSWV